MLNLIANAIKFTPFGGVINVTSKLIKTEDDLSVKDRTFVKIMSNNNSRNYLEV